MVSKNLSVCLSVTKFDPNYLRTSRTEWAEIFLGHLCQKAISQKKIVVRKVGGRAGVKGQNSNILTQYLSHLACNRAENLKKYLNLFILKDNF